MAVGIQANQHINIPDWTTMSLPNIEQLDQIIPNYYAWRAREQLACQPAEPVAENKPAPTLPKIITTGSTMNQPPLAVTSHNEKPRPSSNPTREDEKTAWDAAESSEWCAQMVCYLWYSKSSSLPRPDVGSSVAGQKRPAMDDDSNERLVSPSMRQSVHRPSASTSVSSQTGHDGVSAPSRSQLFPTERFLSFVRNILRMTQVSRSVMAISLLYIYRLKVSHVSLQGQMGSEFRLFLTSLVLANKFLDDHTYTNKTWSDVSHIPLKEITKMEMQLWGGIDTNASASPSEYRWWQSTLERLYDQRNMDLRWLTWSEMASTITPRNSTPTESSPVSKTLPISPHTGSMLETRLSASFHPSMNMNSESDLWTAKRRRSSESNELDKPKQVLRDPASGLARISDVPERGPSSTLHVPGAVAQPMWPNMAFDSSNVNSFGKRGIANEDSGFEALWKDNATGSYSPNDRPSGWNGNNHATLLGRSNPELFLPVKPYSPYVTPQMATHSSSPMVFGYYRLAAGYSHGIPAFRSMDPKGHHGNAMVNTLERFSGGYRNAHYASTPSSAPIPQASPDYIAPSPTHSCNGAINSQPVVPGWSGAMDSSSNPVLPFVGNSSSPVGTINESLASNVNLGAAHPTMYNYYLEPHGRSSGKLAAPSPLRCSFHQGQEN